MSAQKKAAEKDETHAFKTLRYFPELHQSVRNIKGIRKSTGRDFAPQVKRHEREIQLKSTHGLDQYTKSSLENLDALTVFRKSLLEDRQAMKERDNPSIAARAARAANMKTMDPLVSVKEKIAKASLSFDSGSVVNTLGAFSANKDFTKEDLYIQLRRSLNIYLNQSEADALCSFLGYNENNKVESVEFLRFFFKLGNDARAEMRLHRQRKEDAKVEKKLQLEREETARNLFEDDNISLFEGGEENMEVSAAVDLDSVLEKLSTTALNWDNNCFIESVCTSGFECYLTPLQFKQQIDKSFGIKLTQSEVSCLMEKYRVNMSTRVPIDSGKSIHSQYHESESASNVHLIPRAYVRSLPHKKKDTKGKLNHSSALNPNMSYESFHNVGANNNSGGVQFLSTISTSSSYKTMDNYCIDGHKFLKDFLSGTSMKQPALAVLKQQKKIYQKRRDKVNKMGQNVDCLPKVLGR